MRTAAGRDAVETELLGIQIRHFHQTPAQRVQTHHPGLNFAHSERQGVQISLGVADGTIYLAPLVAHLLLPGGGVQLGTGIERDAHRAISQIVGTGEQGNDGHHER